MSDKEVKIQKLKEYSIKPWFASLALAVIGYQEEWDRYKRPG